MEIRVRRRKKGGTRWMVSQYSFGIGRTGAERVGQGELDECTTLADSA